MPSHSACSTIGRSSPETHSRREPSLTRLCKQQRRGKVSSPVTQTLEIILTNCNRYCFTPYCMFYFCLDYNFHSWTQHLIHQGFIYSPLQQYYILQCYHLMLRTLCSLLHYIPIIMAK